MFGGVNSIVASWLSMRFMPCAGYAYMVRLYSAPCRLSAWSARGKIW